MFALLKLIEKNQATDKSGDSHDDMKKFLDVSTQKFLSHQAAKGAKHPSWRSKYHRKALTLYFSRSY